MSETLEHQNKASTDHTEDFGIEATEIKMLESLGSPSGPTPEHLPASKLKELELLRSRSAINSYHTEVLVRELSISNDLTPLLVLHRGERFFLVDGRHRKEAYKEARRGKSIPIVAFAGTPAEAVLEGQKLNRQHTMQLSKPERMDMAWKLVKLDASGVARFPLKAIEVASGAGRSSITKMREVLRTLGTQGYEHSRWIKAKMAFDQKPGHEMSEDEIQDMIEKQGYAIADKMAKAIGARFSDKVEVMAIAMETFMGRRTPELITALRERNETDDDYLFDDDGEIMRDDDGKPIELPF